MSVTQQIRWIQLKHLLLWHPHYLIDPLASMGLFTIRMMDILTDGVVGDVML